MVNKSLAELFATLPQIGRVEWIGIRPAKRQAIVVVDSIKADRMEGLIGDHYAGRSCKRQVTLFQWEHLTAIASFLGRKDIDPGSIRRNIAVSGLNLFALKDKQFRIGDAILEYTGLCHPCSYMEEVFGPGGYNAVRGHGGITAKIVQTGMISTQDNVWVD